MGFKASKAFVCTAVALSMFAATPVPALALTTYNQKGNVLKQYDTKKYKVVNNKNYGKLKYSFKGCGLSNEPHYLKVKKGDRKGLKLTTWAYLPKSFDGSGDMGNPQAIAVTSDGKYAYVSYAATAELKKKFKLSDGQGRIVRYDLQKLEELGVSENGQMSELALASRMRRNAVKNGKNLNKALTEHQRELLSCVTFGPWFKLGHGSTLCYDRTRNALWYSNKTGQIKTNLIRVNIDKLKPEAQYNFKLKDTVTMGNNLVFDKKGRCYFYTYNHSNWAPIGAIKVYRGVIKGKKLKFELTMQCIKYSPSQNIQSIGYNPKNDSLYFVSNGTVVSVPVSKLGKLKKSDVKTSLFDGNREFEGLAFDDSGRCYLLVNKDPEILCADSGL